MSFDTLAPYYRSMEFITAGGILQQCRTAHLGAVADCRRALLLGEGPGRFLTELLRTNPCVAVVCVERSAGMIRAARRELQRQGLDAARVNFVQQDALQWQPAQPDFDLVVTNFFLDCFRRDELVGLIAKIATATTPDACWLLADFRLPESGWQRWRARAVLGLMYGFFRLVTGLSATRLTAPDEFIAAAGFHRAQRRLVNFGLAHADLWRREIV